MSKVLGTCGSCGGPVVGDVDPLNIQTSAGMSPRCARCGREPQNAYGETIQMRESASEPKLLKG